MASAGGSESKSSGAGGVAAAPNLNTGAMVSSDLFQSYRAIGHITDSTPFHLKKLGADHFITCSIGKAWQIFNCDKLRLALVAPAREHRIAAIASVKDFTYTAAAHQIIVWKRTVEVARLSAHRTPVYILSVFGNFLLSLDESQLLIIWDLSTLKLFGTFQVVSSPAPPAPPGPDSYTVCWSLCLSVCPLQIRWISVHTWVVVVVVVVQLQRVVPLRVSLC